MVTKFQKNRERIGLVIYGQSNEAMAVPVTDKQSYPLAFASQKTTGRAVPIGPAKGMTGGWWWYVHDEMWDRGYDLQIANAGIGSLSFLNQASTVTKTWAANTPYYAGRNATGQDFGDFGDVLSVNSGSAFFRCITGNVRTAFSNGGLPDGSGLTGSTSYIRATTNLVSGNTQPNWSSITTNPTGLTDGGTITDGGLLWQRVPNSWYNNRLGSSLRYQFHSGHGFDPLGTMDRALECAKNMRDVTRKIVYIQNAQSDLSNSSTAYSNTLIAIAEYFLMHNLEVMIGLSLWGGNASNSNTTNYNNLSNGVTTAIQTLQAQYPGKVWSGANLYQAMGTTGPMAARTFNGTISNNVLTDNNSLPSGGSWGGQFEVGMKLYDSAGTYYGQIASFGTGTGGAGTYNLTGGVNVTNQDLRAVGAFLSGIDAVHLNGAGAVGPAVSNVSCAGKYVTDAFAAILPDRRPLIVDQYGNAA